MTNASNKLLCQQCHTFKNVEPLRVPFLLIKSEYISLTSPAKRVNNQTTSLLVQEITDIADRIDNSSTSTMYG